MKNVFDGLISQVLSSNIAEERVNESENRLRGASQTDLQR